MQSQVKIFFGLACALFTIATATLMPRQSYATALNSNSVNNPDTMAWNLFNSSQVRVDAFSSAQGEVISSYIPFVSQLGSLFWEWDPRLDEALRAEVEPKLTTSSDGAISKRDQSPYAALESKIRIPKSKIHEMAETLFVKFDVSDIRHFRKVWFQPKQNLKFRGLIGVHDFEKTRPLVIIRMGVHGNVDELIAERFLVKLAYEDLDLNVLVLESLSSHAFMSVNPEISFGGVDEGLQTFFVINKLREMKFSKFISSLHLMSISMGSHGTFVAALLDQYNGKQIHSILNFCPLINFIETFNRHSERGIKQLGIDMWNVRRMKSAFDHYPSHPELQEWWYSLFDLKPRFTPRLFQILDVERKVPLMTTAELSSWFPNMKWPPEFKLHLENSKSFTELNEFWKFYRGVQTPMTIYTTPNDPLVLNLLNSEMIFTGQQPGDFANLKWERLERGIHCGLPPVYKWSYLVYLTKRGLGL